MTIHIPRASFCSRELDRHGPFLRLPVKTLGTQPLWPLLQSVRPQEVTHQKLLLERLKIVSLRVYHVTVHIQQMSSISPPKAQNIAKHIFCAAFFSSDCWPGVRLKKQLFFFSPSACLLAVLTQWLRHRQQTAASIWLPLSAIWKPVTSLPQPGAAALPGCLLGWLFCPSVCTSTIILDCIELKFGRRSPQSSAGLCPLLPPSISPYPKSIFKPPAWCPHPSSLWTLTTQAPIYQRQSLDSNKVSSQITLLVDHYTSSKITFAK